MRDEFNAMRDLLDSQIVDGGQRPLGRVDGIIMMISDGQPPRLLAVESGFPVLLRRLNPKLGAWAAKVAKRWGKTHCRIPMEKIRDIGLDVEIENGPEAAALLAWEDMIRERIIDRIPGGG